MCKWGTYKRVLVTMQPDAEYPQIWKHKEWKKWCAIDKCIAELVEAFESVGLRMLASCCGHGKGLGDILLKDRWALWMTKSFYKWYNIGGL